MKESEKQEELKIVEDIKHGIVVDERRCLLKICGIVCCDDTSSRCIKPKILPFMLLSSAIVGLVCGIFLFLSKEDENVYLPFIWPSNTPSNSPDIRSAYIIGELFLKYQI